MVLIRSSRGYADGVGLARFAYGMGRHKSLYGISGAVTTSVGASTIASTGYTGTIHYTEQIVSFSHYYLPPLY